MTSRGGPLSRVVVVEAIGPDAPDALAHAAGLCGRMAADLGATVIRIAPSGKSETGVFLHHGKRLIATTAEDFLRHVAIHGAGADALICDSGTHAHLSLGPQTIAVLIGMSLDEPLRGSELTAEARCGLLDLIGDPDRAPLRLAGHQLAYSAGLSAYLGLVAALTQRDAGRPAGPVHVDLLDVGVWLNWKALSTAARTGQSPMRPGAKAEWTIVPCRDGYVALVYRIQEWTSLKVATGDARLADPRFETVARRSQNRAELNAILADIFAGKTRAEIRTMALSHKLPLGPVWTPEELKRDPHMIERGYFQPVTVDGQALAMPSLPVLWNGSAFPPGGFAHAAQDNRAISG